MSQAAGAVSFVGGYFYPRVSGDNQSGTNVVWGQPGLIQRHYLIIPILLRSTNRAKWKPEGSQMVSA